MEKHRLEEILEAYGADPRRWPENERAQAQQACIRWAEEVAGVRAEAAALDEALARSEPPTADAALHHRIVDALSAADGAPGGTQYGALRPTPRWGLAAGLAAACVGGYSFAAVLDADLAARRYDAAALAVLQGPDDVVWYGPSAEAQR